MIRPRGVSAVGPPTSRRPTRGGSSGTATRVNATPSRFTRPSLSSSLTSTAVSTSTSSSVPLIVRVPGGAESSVASGMSAAGSSAPTDAVVVERDAPPALERCTIRADRSGFVAVHSISTRDPRGIGIVRAARSSRLPPPR